MADEKDWVDRAPEGDIEAFRFLVERYEARIYRLVARMLGPEHEAMDDVVQDAFVKAYFSLNKFRGESSFGTWITRIAVNRAHDEIKKQRRVSSLDELSLDKLEQYLATAAASEASGAESAAEIGQFVRRAVAALPERFRVVITLKDLEGLSYEEVSKILNRSVGTVKSRHARAREKLRGLLGPRIFRLVRR